MRMVDVGRPDLIGIFEQRIDFGEGAKPAAFVLKDSRVTTKGVMIARYERAGAVVTGDYAVEPPTPAEAARRERLSREG